MVEDWRNTFGILILPLGAGPGGGPRRVQNPFCTNIVMLHIKSKVMKNRIQWCKHFAPGACLGITKCQKVGVSVLFLLSHNSS